ncbi:MAG: hypothetical protein QM713_00035 [Arachnia sp.]
MTVRYERPVSRAAYFARRIAILSFFMFVAAWGLHRFGPLSTPSFLAVAIAAALLSVFAAYLAVIGIGALWFKGARGGKASAAALMFADPSARRCRLWHRPTTSICRRSMTSRRT